MRKKLLGLCFIIIAYAGFLIATIPAKFALSYVDLPRNVQLQSVSGSIWQGNINRVIVNNITLRDVNWQAQITSLLSGDAEIAVQFGRGKNSLRGDGVLGYNGDGAFARDFLLRTTSGWLINSANVALPVTVKGDVKLQLTKVSQGLPWCQELEGQLSWDKASVDSLLGLVEVGAAKAKLSCDNGKIAVDVKQNSSHLRLSGKATLGEQRRYRFTGALVPGNELPKAIRSNLGYVGKVNSKGEYKLNYSGRL